MRSLRRLGYAVQWRELRACDYGAPTIRKRLFVIARCDGRPIVWPDPTHGQGLIPYRTAADIIDWSIPCPSIFDNAEEIWRKYGVRAQRPLAEATLRRIAKGIRRYVLEAAEPFIVTYYGQKKDGDFRGRGMDDQLGTQTTENRHALVVPTLITNTSGHAPSGADAPMATLTTGQQQILASACIVGAGGPAYAGKPVSVGSPLGVVQTENHRALVAAYLSRWFGQSKGQACHHPAPTVMPGGQGKTALVASHLLKLKGTGTGQATDDPLHTVQAGGLHYGEVRAFLVKYFGQGVGQSCTEPVHTVTSRDRFGLVTVHGQDYVIADIGMRMLTPRELFRAQGFPESYIIDPIHEGQPLTKSAQVRAVGNSVCPDIAAALVRANLCTAQEAAA